MMTITLANDNKFSPESSEHSLVEILLGYIQTNLEFYQWQKFLDDPHYISLQQHGDKYRDAMFRDLVNLGSTYLSTTVPELLESLVQHKLDRTLNKTSESDHGCQKSDIEEFVSYGVI